MSTAVIPQPQGSQFVELGRQRSGALFDKHILSAGPLIHPKTGQAINVTPGMLDTIVANFQSNVCPIVQVPLANDRNQHSEDPARNTGEVIGLRREGHKLVATMDVRDKQAADKIRQGLILGSSAFLHLDYTDTRTGRKVGPALLHNCLTNRPYVVDLEPFQEVAASSGLGGEVVMLSYSDGDSVMPDSDELTLTRDDLDGAYAELAQGLGLPEYVIRDEVAALAGHYGTGFSGLIEEADAIAAFAQPAPHVSEEWRQLELDRLVNRHLDPKRTPWEQTQIDRTMPSRPAPEPDASQLAEIDRLAELSRDPGRMPTLLPGEVAGLTAAEAEGEILRLSAFDRAPQQSKMWREDEVDAKGDGEGSEDIDVEAEVRRYIDGARAIGLVPDEPNSVIKPVPASSFGQRARTLAR